MKILLKIDSAGYGDVLAHLLPASNEQEQAAFLFARADRGPAGVTLDVIETEKLVAADFVVQTGDHLELTAEARARLIKRAHDLEASLVELHSHIGPWPAGFSLSDRIGLAETVPHMWWRLRKRPYLAIVVAKSGFDALLWLDNPKVPRALDAILAGGRMLKPTNLSLGGWG